MKAITAKKLYALSFLHLYHSLLTSHFEISIIRAVDIER